MSADSANSTEALFAALPGQAMPVSDSEVLFMPQGRDDRHVMTMDVYAAFEQCQVFAPLSEHGSRIREHFPALTPVNVERVLQNLAQRGLLQSEAQTLELLQAESKSAHNFASDAPLNTLAIMSPGHPAALEALLASTESAGDSQGARDRAFVLLDVSENAEHRARKTELMAEFGRKTGQRVLLLDSKRERWMQERLAQLPEHAEGIEQLLGKSASLKSRAMNSLALAMQGERILLVDDAARMRTFTSGAAGEISPGPQGRRARLLDPSDGALRQQSRAQSLWEISAAMLGKRIAQLTGSLGLSGHTLSELQGYEKARVARISLGVVGSADTAHSLWAFGIEANQHALIKNKDALSQVLAGDSVMLGYAQASLAPPLGSAPHAIDFSLPLGFALSSERDLDISRSFASLSSFVEAGAMELCVPVALERRAAPVARELSNREPLALSVAQFLAEHVASLQTDCFAATPGSRWRWLAVQCLDLAEAPARDREELLWRYITAKRAELLAQLQNYHMQASAPNELWRHELLNLISVQAQTMLQATHFVLDGFSKDQKPADALSSKLQQLAQQCLAWAALSELKAVWK